ncbi:MAG: Aminoglycoside N(6)-acetyltransferase [Anaerocolumna sp.]|jgi:aminoglycoside 6'-N-acetyltransferase I|nr:Aminoglycoside N(6)-acetyltransferase [Anaerocolumna sp.]
MQIIDLNIENESMLNQTATILYEAFPHSWTNMQEALEEVHECSSNDRISRVTVDDEMNVLGWIGGRSMYSGNVWELHPLVVESRFRGKGIGSALVKDFEEQVRIKGGITVWLGADDENGSTTLSGIDVYPDVLKHIAGIRNIKQHPYEFYQKLGYTIVGILPDANGFGKPDIYLAKRVGEIDR